MLAQDTFRVSSIVRGDRSRFANQAFRELTNDDLLRVAPSVFADSPWNKMSARYKFVPTIQVVDWMREEGFLPVRALQSRSRIEGKSEFTKHMVRFRHRNEMDRIVQGVGDEFTEITLVNSHDGTSAYQLYPSLFRAVCLNGLIVHSEDLEGVSCRHKGGNDFHQEIIDASFRVIDETPRIVSQISEFKEIELSPQQQNAFATAALELQSSKSLQPRHVLAARREGDQPGTLWNTFNKVQENMVKGGIPVVNPETRTRRRTTGIKSVTGDVSTNRALWRLAEEMAKLVS